MKKECVFGNPKCRNIADSSLMVSEPICRECYMHGNMDFQNNE